MVERFCPQHSHISYRCYCSAPKLHGRCMESSLHRATRRGNFHLKLVRHRIQRSSCQSFLPRCVTRLRVLPQRSRTLWGYRASWSARHHHEWPFRASGQICSSDGRPNAHQHLLPHFFRVRASDEALHANFPICAKKEQLRRLQIHGLTKVCCAV